MENIKKPVNSKQEFTAAEKTAMMAEAGKEANEWHLSCKNTFFDRDQVKRVRDAIFDVKVAEYRFRYWFYEGRHQNEGPYSGSAIELSEAMIRLIDLKEKLINK